MNGSNKTTVLVAEDHAIVRQGLCGLLEAGNQVRVIGEACNGREAVAMAAALHPDIILMDIAMPKLNGLDASRQILAADPTARVLVLSAHNESIYVHRMTKLGVVGFIEKRLSADYLTKAISEIIQGRSYYSPAIGRLLRKADSPWRTSSGYNRSDPIRLTTRETEVLQQVAEGAANKQVAAVLGLSVKTIEKHRQTLMNKLDIHETAGLTRYAIAQGIIECGAPSPARS